MVKAPCCPGPASTSACRTHSRSDVGVKSISLATLAIERPPSRTNRTASALNSGPNDRRFRFAMNTSRRIVAPVGVSTKAGNTHHAELWEMEMGFHVFRWGGLDDNGSAVPDGLYFVEVGGDVQFTSRVVVLR